MSKHLKSTSTLCVFPRGISPAMPGNGRNHIFPRIVNGAHLPTPALRRSHAIPAGVFFRVLCVRLINLVCAVRVIDRRHVPDVTEHRNAIHLGMNWI